MKSSFVIATGLLVIGTVTVQAQTSCPSTVPTATTAPENAKQQAADVFQYVAPQLATAIAGGSPTLGQTSTLGGLGHFSVGVRGTALKGSIPQVNQFPTCYSGKYSATLPTSSQVLPGAGADAAIGIFGGLPLALTNVGAVDLLLSATYIPEFDRSSVRVTLPDGSLKIGYGARIGLLSESILVPGVSLSYMKRDLPTVNLSATSGVADSLFVTGLKLKTTSWRIEASKSLLMFGVFGGVGKDKYESSVDLVRASVGAPVVGRTSSSLTPAPSQSLDRTNLFVGLKLNLLIFKLAGEVGQASGGDITTFNSFSGSAANASRTYASLGVRFGI
ncbi:MAG TPA: hypothetical protein VM033_06030 [Gemmatimonadaceae bacterium]|nr:hypothetical protein [Gemmatimonadaceae bacterium]